MAGILYSHRTTDSKELAQRILDRLKHNYDDIITDSQHYHGNDHTYFEGLLGNVSALVLIIGPNWATSKAKGGTRRLDKPDDPIRLEVEAAASKGVPIIPVLVRGASMPSEESLPEGMKLLAQATPVVFGGDAEFRGGMQKLHRQIASAVSQRERPKVQASPVSEVPIPARKDLLNSTAAAHVGSKHAPFAGVRIESLGEVLWILGAQRGPLGRLYGERRFEPDLSGANLSYLNLSGAPLVGAKLAGCNLAYADLSGADLTGGVLSDANLTEANLTGAKLDQATMQSAKLQNTNLTRASLKAADLTDVNLTTANLSGVSFAGATMQHADLTGTDLSSIDLRNADLTEANLTETTLVNAHLGEAKLEGAKLGAANLSGADLSCADLSAAKLELADMSAANLCGTTISDVKQMEEVIIDGGTQFKRTKWGGRDAIEPRSVKQRDKRLKAYRDAAYTNHKIAEMFRNAGFIPEASRFRLAEQTALRGILLTNHKYGAWIFSCLLNLISGYGERIGRTLTTYLAIVAAFTLIYFVGTNYLDLATTHLDLYQSLLQSVVSFHGRGFVSSALALHDPMAGVTILEGVAGLFVEAMFIATFGRRFLSD